MAKENYDGLYGLFGSALTAFDLASKAKQIKCDYNLRTKINSLLCFVDSSKVVPANP